MRQATVTKCESRRSWQDHPVLALDTETTGVDPSRDRLVTASVARIDAAGQCHSLREWLVDPGVAIPDAATQVHGITTEHARTHGRDPASVLGEITAVLRHEWRRAGALVVFNASFDLTLLRCEQQRHALTPLRVGPVLDPLVLDRGLDRSRRGSRRLTALAAHYGVTLTDADAHGASADAVAAAQLIWILAQHYPFLATAGLEQLQARQATWHANWARGYARWLHSQPDRSATRISPSWPVQQLPAR